MIATLRQCRKVIWRIRPCYTVIDIETNNVKPSNTSVVATVDSGADPFDISDFGKKKSTCKVDASRLQGRRLSVLFTLKWEVDIEGGALDTNSV